MQPKLTYEVGADDLKQALSEVVREQVEDKVYNRFYNAFVDCKTIGTIHNLSQNTVTRYIQDGILTPEPGTKKFRLSEILKLDLTTIKHRKK